MRDKFANILAVFVPLAFIGGYSQGGIGLAIGAAVFWGIVFLIVRPKY
jgi:hypothetical protein